MQHDAMLACGGSAKAKGVNGVVASSHQAGAAPYPTSPMPSVVPCASLNVPCPSPSVALRCGSALSERTNTTSSTDSLCGSDVSEFLADIQTEMLDQYGAVGTVSQIQLIRTLTAMGLDSSESLVHALWRDAAQVPDQPLATHEILSNISTHLAPRGRTPAADGTNSVGSAAHTPKFSKSRPTSVQNSSACTWWGAVSADTT